ncbi:MAG: thioredoxin [Bacteroidales bacterium]|nr:thioredoxin [Bacteroidales bacterium]
MVQNVTDSNFEDLLSKGGLMIVDFWATWCGPCRMLSPIVDELADEFAGKLTVAKCNVDEASDVPMKYSIRNIPTLLFFKNGELVDRSVGAVPKSDIVARIEKYL